jgi:hypothetical protein
MVCAVEQAVTDVMKMNGDKRINVERRGGLKTGAKLLYQLSVLYDDAFDGVKQADSRTK